MERSDMKRFDLVVVGDVNPDLIVSAPDLQVEFGQRETLADRAELRLGGSASIAACAAARLGLRVAFVGLVGDDAYAAFCLDELRSHGVDVDAVVVDPAVPTGLTVILERRGDRAIVTAPGSIAAFAVRHVDRAVLAAARHVHLGSFFLLDGLRAGVAELFDAAHAAGATTSLDTNDDPARTWRVDGVLERCDILLPNDAEARALAGVHDVLSAATALARDGATVAVTVGVDGAIAVRGDEYVEVAAVPVDAADVVDAVGAGDNFDAGFLAGHLEGWPLERCLELGVAAAAASLRGPGGTGALGSLAPVVAGAASDG